MQGVRTQPQNDANEIVIDTSDESIKWRYTCPHGHLTYEPTNGGIWCRACDHDDEIDEAHHHAIKDKSKDKLIDFDRIILT